MNKELYEKIINQRNQENPLGNEPFDTVFKTLLEKCTGLMIPVINEVFHTHYSMDDDIQLLSAEHYFKDEKGVLNKRVADSCIFIGKHLYHLECQTNKDSSMELRMVEYDFHIALSFAESVDGIYTLKFPESAVLYLRDNKNIPKVHQVKLILPDKSEAVYSVPIIKVREYNKETIFDKKLLFFIPYYVLRFESQMQEINDNPDKLEQFKAEYQEIYGKLRSLGEKEEIDKRYLGQLVELTNDLLKVVAKDAEHVKEEVAHMGGQVITTNTDLLIAYGEEKGKAEGIEQTIIEGIVRSMKKQNLSYEDACDFMDIPKEQRADYYEKVMEKVYLIR